MATWKKIATQTELDLKANIASPTFTGTVAIPNIANLETAVTANVNVDTDLGITTNASGFAITSSTGTGIACPAATTSAWGVMTDEDKTKLDGIAASADVNTDVDVSVSNLETRLGEIDSDVTIGNAVTVNTTISGDLEVAAQMMVKGAGADSKLVINNTGIASIDTILEFQKGNAAKFVIGFDDGDDTFKMNSGGNFAGTADFEMDTSGNLTIAGDVNGASATELGHLSGVSSSLATTITTANDAMPKNGGTFTGVIVLAADPLVDLGAATKQYVDSRVERMSIHCMDMGARMSYPNTYYIGNISCGTGITTGDFTTGTMHNYSVFNAAQDIVIKDWTFIGSVSSAQTYYLSMWDTTNPTSGGTAPSAVTQVGTDQGGYCNNGRSYTFSESPDYTLSAGHSLWLSTRYTTGTGKKYTYGTLTINFKLA